MCEAMAGHDEAIVCAVVSFLVAIGCLIAGFAESRDYFPFSIFAFAVAVAFMLPTIWDLKTKR
jgi:hypothetical protein